MNEPSIDRSNVSLKSCQDGLDLAASRRQYSNIPHIMIPSYKIYNIRYSDIEYVNDRDGDVFCAVCIDGPNQRIPDKLR